ncbi:ribosome-inactivating family protein [Streptomyces sp. TLI_185]|uniref:ribosome-inactivating family protein n=1 Tax=Streptomyces sp. TLI_185 TaxID=2485151 RepID=UPI000F4F89BD|nr:ribosome-inactivating family protein [Streptomyces sp. TLI_185]RPF37250.1 ribosome inactivating protein [Streptomyces sp. TLI_185]
MPTSVLMVVALSVLLGFLVIMLAPRDTDTSASTAADQVTINSETVAGREHIDFPQVHWNIQRGSGAYLTMLDELRNLAETSADGRVMPNVDTGADSVITDDTETRSFADVVISSGNHIPAVHAIVRLSDFCVVRFFSSDTPHNVALNLASDVPDKEDATDDNWSLGKQGYDALARVANQSLTEVNLSESSLENSLRDLGVRGTDRTAQARGMLRYIMAITEASRFRPIAHRIANGMDNGSDVFVTAQQVGLMRN